MLEMRNILQKKLNKKGFTLAELLVVVAIIAVLVAVSIPIFTAKLEKSRESTDLANMRAAKAIAATDILSEDMTNYTKSGSDYVGYYDASAGVMAKAAPTVKYGQGTATGGGCKEYMGYSETTDASNKAIKVTISGENITMAWE